MRSDPNEVVAVGLSGAERDLIEAALLEWGGGAHGTEKIAQAIGFKSMHELWRERDRILSAVRDRSPLSRADWTRLLLATEIAFASDVVGAGVEWSTVTGFDDVESLTALRSLQRTLAPAISRASIG